MGGQRRIAHVRRQLGSGRTALVLAVVGLAVAAAGCGGSSKKTSTPTTGTTGGTGTSTTGGSTGGAAIKVGLVTDIGGLNDRSFNHLAYVGLQRAQSQLGVTGRVLESKSAGDYIPNLSSLAARTTTS